MEKRSGSARLPRFYDCGDGGLRSEDAADLMYDTAEDDQPVTMIEYWYKRYDPAKRRYRVHMAQAAGGALRFR